MAGPAPLLWMGQAALEAWAGDQGQPAFRGRQLHDWIYAKGARRLSDVSALPKAWRDSLAQAGQSLASARDASQRARMGLQ